MSEPLLTTFTEQGGSGTLLDAIPDLVCLVDGQGFLTRVNSASLTILGYEPASLQGMHLCDLLSEGQDLVRAELKKLADGPMRRIWFHRHAQGQRLALDWSLAPLEQGFIGIARPQPLQSPSERQLLEICRSIPGAIFQMRLESDGRIRLPFMSEGIERLTGLTAAALQQQPEQLYDLIHLYDRKHFFYSLESSAQELVPWPLRFRMRNVRTQEYHWVRWDAMPRLNEDGSLVWNGTLLDVNEAETAAEILRIHSMAIESMNQGMIILDPHHLGMPVIYANPQYYTLTGYTPAEVLNQDCPFLQGPLRQSETASRIRKAIRAGTSFSGEILSFRKNGTPFWNLLTLSPVHDPAGKLTHFVALQADVTELKKAMEELRHSSERFRLLASATHQAVWDWNMPEAHIQWNEGLHSIFGYAPESVSTAADWRYERIHPDERDLVQAEMHQALREQNPYWQGEYRFADAQGIYHWVLDRACILFADGQPVRMIGAMFDISPLKESEEILRRLNQDLLRQNRDLQQFSYITSHNLRAPVANILGLSQLLTDEESSVEFRAAALEGIQQAAQNLDRIIQDLNQILSQRQHILEDREDINLHRLIQQVLTNLSVLTRETEPTLHEDLDVPSLYSVRSYFESILQNLLSNAMKYRHPDRPLEIYVNSRRADGKILLSVQDNGLGMNLNVVGQRLFQLYKRFHAHIEGQGLGLYLVKTQVEAIGGSIDVESIEGEGSCFTIQLRDER